jgi:hypothetical protein
MKDGVRLVNTADKLMYVDKTAKKSRLSGRPAAPYA